MAYTMMGKVVMIEVHGALPRVGDILIYPNEDNVTFTRFRVREVQTPLKRSTNPFVLGTGTPEVHVDLVD